MTDLPRPRYDSPSPEERYDAPKSHNGKVETMNTVIEEILHSYQVQDQEGRFYHLTDNIDREEGHYLQSVILADSAIKKTLEIGCAYGLSSLFICDALSGRAEVEHVIIDPFQHSSYGGIGLHNLLRAGFSFYRFIEEPSEFALPNLARIEFGSFDMVFIDGWHTFDHTLLDLFYANLLLRTGGYLVVDDCRLLPVSKAVSYMANYPSYNVWSTLQRDMNGVSLSHKGAYMVASLLAHPLIHQVLFDCMPKKLYDGILARHRFSSMVTLKKVEDDKRSWSWYEVF